MAGFSMGDPLLLRQAFPPEGITPYRDRNTKPVPITFGIIPYASILCAWRESW
jgi:hypothetical protein